MTRWSLFAIRGIEKLADIADGEFSKRTTIKRILAIEESTWHWSLAEVAEHILIVNRRVFEVVRCLAEGKNRGPMWIILDVKPKARPIDDLRAESSKKPARCARSAGMPPRDECAAGSMTSSFRPLDR